MARDWFGFWYVKSLGKIQFGFDNLKSAHGNTLLVTTPGNLPSEFQQIDSIKNLEGEDVFLIARRKR